MLAHGLGLFQLSTWWAGSHSCTPWIVISWSTAQEDGHSALLPCTRGLQHHSLQPLPTLCFKSHGGGGVSGSSGDLAFPVPADGHLQACSHGWGDNDHTGMDVPGTSSVTAKATSSGLPRVYPRLGCMCGTLASPSTCLGLRILWGGRQGGMSWATAVAELLVGEPRSHAGGCRGGPCSRPWEQDIFQLRRNKGIQGPVAGAGGAGWGGAQLWLWEGPKEPLVHYGGDRGLRRTVWA